MEVFIDNCSLLQLAYTEGYSQQLIALENFINSGNITLLTHSLILEEWEKNKPLDRERKLKKLSGRFAKAAHQSGSLLPSIIPVHTSHIDEQYNQLDKLLKQAKLLLTPPAITHEFAERYRKGLAPFHKKKESLNDWEIIGSAAHYAELNRLSRLYFISSNCNDFADRDNNKVIHPDLQIRFPGVQIHYYSDIREFLADLNTAILPHRLITYNIVRNERYSYKASIKKTELDSLYYLFKDMYGELAFVPPHILVKYHPFATSADSWAYFGLFSLYEVREQLTDIFEKIEVTGPGDIKIIDETPFLESRDYREKIAYVLLRMTNNLIFNLQSTTRDKKTSVYYTEKETCDCVKCSYQRMDLKQSLIKLKDPAISTSEKSKSAYFHYQFGHYNTAARLYIDVREEALEAKQYLTYYLSLYNLRHLGRLLENPFRQVTLTPEELISLKEIDPIEECVKLKSFTDYDLLTYIADGEFFKDALDEVSKLSTEIEDAYYSTLNGGYSCDSNVWNMIKSFAELDAFINNNFVIYDTYSNFERLFDLFVKGIFAAHALVNTESSSLEHMDDYLVSKIIVYGKRATLYKYFNRYGLKSLAYRSEPSSRDSFTILAINLLKSEKTFKKKLLPNTTEKNSWFYEKFNRWFQNIMTLAAMLELDSLAINRLSRELLKFLKTERSLDRDASIAIAGFIRSKGGQINKVLRDEMLTYFSENFDRYYRDVLSAVLRLYSDGELKSFDHPALINDYQNGKPERKESVLQILGLVYQKSAAQDQDAISERVRQLLRDKPEHKLSYFCLMIGIIKPDRKTLGDLLNNINIIQEHTFRSAFSGVANHHITSLDELIQICFKYDIDTRTSMFKRFKKISPFYEWLLDMNGFDYKCFDVNWINHYRTKTFYAQMSRSKKLKVVLAEHLRSNSHPKLEKILIKITYFGEERASMG